MSKAPNYYIVDAEALPEIFHKVVQARRMLDTGEAETVNQAVQLVGISRSAFYKYKDAVRPFQDMLHGRIVTFQMMLKDEPGILSHSLPAPGPISSPSTRACPSTAAPWSR